jgi:phosphoserine phosphatase
VIAQLKRELNPVYTIMVGDGVSDLESKAEVDRFIGFGRYVIRAAVKNKADAFISSLDELLRIL